MKMDRTASRVRAAGLLASAIVVAVAAAVAPAPGSASARAAAQTSRPAAETRPQERPAPVSDPAAILAGPRVEPSALVETDSRSGAPVRRDQRPGVPPRRWLAIVWRLDLTDDQRKKVREIISQLDADRRVFKRKHGQEMREMRRAAGRRAKSGGDDQARRPREMRARMQELQGLAPKVETYQQRVWDELTPAQQDDLRRELARVRAEMAARRRDGQGLRGRPRDGAPGDRAPRDDQRRPGEPDQPPPRDR